MHAVRDFFDRAYASTDRYWWRVPHVYSPIPEDHASSLITQTVLRYARTRRPGRALDLGSGEGADAIRLALMGWDVVAVELSGVGVDKTRRFAAAAGVHVGVVQADITEFTTAHRFDLVICNGVLHYVADKHRVCRNIQAMTVPGGANAISLWSDYTPVPDCHQVVPTYPDAEQGQVVSCYASWRKVLLYFERGRMETGHGDMPEHRHSHIKLFALNRADDGPGSTLPGGDHGSASGSAV